MKGLEQVYKTHHAGRGDNFAILMQERGAFLKRHIGTDKVILDIGCRDGQLTSTYLEGNTVTGVDIDKDALARATERLGITTIHADLNEDWNFITTQYDVVVACEFLEHIYFPAIVLQKINAALKPGGRIVGTVPQAYSMQSRFKFLLGRKQGTPLEDQTHINHFSHQEFKALLEAQFTDVVVEGWVPKRYRLLAKLFPLAFAHDLMFTGVKK